jgi:hypothetical protein
MPGFPEPSSCNPGAYSLPKLQPLKRDDSLTAVFTISESRLNANHIAPATITVGIDRNFRGHRCAGFG